MRGSAPFILIVSLVLFSQASTEICYAAGELTQAKPATPATRTIMDQPTSRLILKGYANKIERTTVLMGTEVHFLILSDDVTGAGKAIDAAIAEIRRIEDMMSDWDKTTPLSAINISAGASPVKVPKELTDIITRANVVSSLTSGKFDITYKGAGHMWDFTKDPPYLPDRETIELALKLINYEHIVIDTTNSTVFLPRPGMQIGLGGVAKGYAVDRAVATIKKAGFNRFAVNAGGDLVCRGRKDGGLWWVGIKDPRALKDNIAILPIANLAVATSGDYERFFMLNGKRYAHIIDPDTGWPVDHCQSVTIMAKTAEYADAIATGVFVLGPTKGLALIESLDNVEGMIIDASGNLHVSTALRQQPKTH
jgi:thiamine biosynthesis lipoprotein